VCRPRRGSGIGLPSCSVEYSQHERFGRRAIICLRWQWGAGKADRPVQWRNARAVPVCSAVHLSNRRPDR
jgi:hypothetical protein